MVLGTPLLQPGARVLLGNFVFFSYLRGRMQTLKSCTVQWAAAFLVEVG